jgi:hypothetical protein
MDPMPYSLEDYHLTLNDGDSVEELELEPEGVA